MISILKYSSLPLLITSKNFLMESKDSVDANDDIKVSKDVHGIDYHSYNTLKTYKSFCTSTGYWGAITTYCNSWAKKW